MAINLLALPQVQAPRSLLLDLAPINQALDYQQALQQQAFQNSRAMAQDRRAASAEDRAAQMAPLQQAQAQAAIDASRGSETRAQAMHPLDMQARRASIAATNAQLAQTKSMTPEGRAAIAGRFGIDVNTPEGRTFMLTGAYTPKTERIEAVDPTKLLIKFGADGSVSRVTIPGMTGDPEVERRRQQLKAAGLSDDDPRHKVYMATGKMPREDQAHLTASDKKAILEADEMVMTTQGVIKSLNDAVELSKLAYSGPGAATRGYAMSLIGSKEGKATEELNNLITQNALTQLKAIFGGAPTEGERKILLDIQGSVNQAPDVREKIYKRAAALAENRLRFYRERASQMRGQTYYKPQQGGAGLPAGWSLQKDEPQRVD